MNKLIVSGVAMLALAAGAAWAQGGDAESQAGSAWRGTQNYGPYTPYAAPGAESDAARLERAQRGIGPTTPAEVYGNSGYTPPAPYGYPGYVYRGVDAWGRPLYSAAAGAAPANPFIRHDRANRRDRDGDGVRNNRDRYPDDSRRW